MQATSPYAGNALKISEPIITTIKMMDNAFAKPFMCCRFIVRFVKQTHAKEE